MPLFDMHTPTGRLDARLKAQALAERDIQNYGPIERTDEEISTRIRSHLEQIERTKFTPETVVTDDPTAFSKVIQEGYEKAYKGLMVGYTGLREPYRLQCEPRYTTSVNFDGSEDEHPFSGKSELLVLLKTQQDALRAEEQELLSVIQVSIFDRLNPYSHPHFIAYAVEGDELVGVDEQSSGQDDIILGFGLPVAADFYEEEENSRV